MSTVILAEKPSVAREIAAFLGAVVKGDGCLQTRDGKRVVTWAFGHLVRYAEPHEYGEAWSGRWNLEDLPMVRDTWLTKVQQESSAQFNTVSKLMKRAERVVCATDAGREGEHIFRLIYQRAGCTAPVQRLWVSSLTQEALKQGFLSLKPGSDFDRLGEAAQARAKADWLVGFN
ncbi:MAG: toprim domain-containing protein, partial [Candidatus Tectomicrobia bacterium]|nr:toprim domain-containing protein [Candidatus Tectomicrobia bacterium]